MRTIEVRTERRTQLVDITAQVAEAARGEGRPEGVVLVFCPHTTAGLTLNESYDPDVARDIEAVLARLAPREGGYAHREGNADAHVKASLVGSACLIPWVDGRLMLGTWQGVFLCEFDGPRTRRVMVHVL